MTAGNRHPYSDEIRPPLNRQHSFFLPSSSNALFINMPLIYGDSFQDDEDVCNMLAAMWLSNSQSSDTSVQHNPPSPVTRRSMAVVSNDPVNRISTVVAEQERPGHQQESDSAPAAGGPCSPIREQPSVSSTNTHCKCPF